MAIESERKFLVDVRKLPPEILKADFYAVESGYFTEFGNAIRVTHRVGGKCKFCLKSPVAEVRYEFEYTIPEPDARRMLDLSPTHLVKHRTVFQGWEVDRIELGGTTEDLWIAEWEKHEGQLEFPAVLPAWIVKEVTGEYEFSMQGLAWKWGRRT